MKKEVAEDSNGELRENKEVGSGTSYTEASFVVQLISIAHFAGTLSSRTHITEWFWPKELVLVVEMFLGGMLDLVD